MWEVYAYWNVELLESVFNGLAAISGSNAYETLMYAIALLGFIVVMAAAVARIRAEEPMMWIFFLTFFYGVLFIPKDSVVIIDRTAASGAAPRIVNNVPIGAAAFVSMTSKIGDWLTRTYETAFSIPDTLKYTGNGMTFGARIIQAATNAHFIDVKLNQDLMEYIRSCVAPDLVNGHKDLETLMKSEDIWAEMGETNPARAVWLTATGIGVTDCLTGYEQLTPKVNAATQQAHSWVSRMLNARVAVSNPHANLNALLATQLPGAAEVLLKVTTANSMDFVKQAALANLWRIAPGSLAAAVENTSAAQLAIAEAIAQESSRVAYKSMANISAEALPKFRNAFQVVIISVFPIIMLMILFMGHKGGIVLKHYVLALLWIETWPVIFAVSSYLAQVDSAGPTMSLIGGLANPPVGQGISMLNIGAVQDWMLRTEHVAGVLTTWIPGFAAALLWGGAFAMTSIAGSVMAPAQSAAQRAGSEVGMGNVNMGNLRYDTFAARTTEANSWNTRSRYAPGAMPGQQGGWERVDDGMSTYRTATGEIRENEATRAARMPVVQAAPTNLGGALTAGAGTSAANTNRSDRQATAGETHSAKTEKTDAASMAESDSVRFGREFARAVENAWRTGSSYGRNWGAGSQRQAGSSVDTNDQTGQSERAIYSSNVTIGGGLNTNTQQSQTYDPNQKQSTDKKEAKVPALPGPQAAEKSNTLPGQQEDKTNKAAITRKPGGLDGSIGYNAQGLAELAYTAATGASNRWGLNREQAANILREAARSVAASTSDRGVRAAAEEMIAKLDRGFTVQDARAVEATMRESASETRERGTSANTQSGFNLDTWVQAYAAGKGIGATDLLNMMQTQPDTFRALVREAKSAWEASQEGQAHLTQGGNLNAPRSVDSVFAQGVGNRIQELQGGYQELSQRHAGNEQFVQKQQPANPRSQPNINPVIRQVNAEEWKAFNQYRTTEAGQKYQAGAALLANYAVRNEHGGFAPLRIAFGIAAPKSPNELMERIHHLAATDPTVRDQIAHLGSLANPTESQIKATAEYIEARAKARKK